ncbi:MAG: cell envelope integrity EipB family protein [Roseibium sp.]|nr:cell envelope integrity EipB family protein [Roseibium sp.]
MPLSVRASLIVGLMLVVPLDPVAASPTGLAPHRAVYDMSMGDIDAQSSLTGLSGLMVYDFAGDACEGYSVTFRFVTEFHDESGSSQVTDLQTSSFEEPDATRYQFFSKTYVNQNLVEATRGTARQNADAKTIDLAEPEKRQVDISGTALFPTEHLLRILKEARDGATFVAADVFDGSESGDKVYNTTTVIGAPKQDPTPVQDRPLRPYAPIADAVHWPVTIAYFDSTEADAGEQMPVYQLTFLLYENGISRELMLDYGEFTIKGKLRALELYETGDCPQ